MMSDSLEQLRAHRNIPDKDFALASPMRKAHRTIADMASDPSLIAARQQAEKERAERERQRALNQRMLAFDGGDFPPRSVALVKSCAALTWPKPEVRDLALRTLLANRCVLMLGDSGPGKTTMATELAYVLALEHGVVPRYAKAADLVGDFRYECYGANKSSEGAWMRRWKRDYGLLVIDEYDKRADSDKSADMVLMRLLDGRYDEMTATVIISNLTPRTWAAQMDRSIKSRLDQWGVQVVFDWPSFRGGTSKGAAA